MTRVVAVIPCRYGSTRFPGKPLAQLAGVPLMWHVYQRCLRAQHLDEAVVATTSRTQAPQRGHFTFLRPHRASRAAGHPGRLR